MVLTHVLTVSKGYSYTLSLPHFWCMAGFLHGTLFAHGLHKFTALAFVNGRLTLLIQSLQYRRNGRQHARIPIDKARVFVQLSRRYVVGGVTTAVAVLSVSLSTIT